MRVIVLTPGLILADVSHMAIIRALVGAGASIHLANNFGGTCLINSVQSSELVSFLLSQVRLILLAMMIKDNEIDFQGADVNAEDVQHKTALHYAIQAGSIILPQKYIREKNFQQF